MSLNINKLSIVIFGDDFAFPEGDAATNRVHTYAKGFIENGLSVHVICFASDYSTEGSGSINGINYYHPFGQRSRNKFLLIRAWYKFTKYFSTLGLFIKINKSDPVLAINSWTQNLTCQFYIYLLAKLISTKLISEHSEHPLRKYQGSSLRIMRGELKSYLGSKLCDGILCISQYLIEFYAERGINRKRLFLVPSTVDTERFKIRYSSPLDINYILYCGTLTLLKDGVDILIKSFAIISERFPDLYLVLLGKANTLENEILLKTLVNNLAITKRVIFLGQIPRNNVPAYLTNAKILALARPSSIIADAGFPSKLTEYLATGIPVVVTAVGEIPVYLKDGLNAFLCDPDISELFAEKLQFVLDNYSDAKKVAIEGQKLTETIFNYNYQASRIVKFTKSLH
jgi:glycosyltransferase involved in cell wall biosynthesis